jgi:hypothetical protein
MTNLIPFLIIILFVPAGTIILRTASAQRNFLQRYRGTIDPPYPLLPEELRNAR